MQLMLILMLRLRAETLRPETLPSLKSWVGLSVCSRARDPAYRNTRNILLTCIPSGFPPPFEL
jgi:hypothetical protein